MYAAIKRYGHDRGLSTAFRQWRAKSHCRLVHGYSLAFEFEFRCMTLNESQWVQDFGGLSDLKDALTEAFDHTLAVAASDPELELFKHMGQKGVARLLILPEVSCERFAEYAGLLASQAAPEAYAKLYCVTVNEHEGNAARWFNPEFKYKLQLLQEEQ